MTSLKRFFRVACFAFTLCVTSAGSSPAQTSNVPPTAPAAQAAAPDTAPNPPARRGMRNGLDAEAMQLPKVPVATTILALSAIARPGKLPLDARVKPLETTLWSVDGELVSSAAKPDGDIFLVLSDADGRTLTAELPDPDKVKKSAWVKDIATARKSFNDFFTASQKTGRAKAPRVRIAGAGYFGKMNSEESNGDGLPNGVQLHPVTSFVVLP